MSIRKVSFAPGEFYHVYNRGNSKQKIFKDEEDYVRFTDLLFACNSENSFKIDNLDRGKDLYSFERGRQLVHIGAYCLMPNHFHIILTQPEEGSISVFMQKLATAYVMYFNKKYERTGGLFEGKFKSEHLGEDRYLKYIFSYIHLNPIKLINKEWREKGIKDIRKSLVYLNSYPYSSYLDFKGNKRIQEKILNKNKFPDYFPKQKHFKQEIFDWLKYKEFKGKHYR